MASFVRKTFDGVSDIIDLTFGYLDKSHVSVYLDGVLVDPGTLTWNTDAQIKLASPPASGTDGLARRLTPSSPITTFAPGNLDPLDLNVSDRQSRYMAEEARDTALDNAARHWATYAYGAGGTIKKGADGEIAMFDASGNLVNKTVPAVFDVNFVRPAEVATTPVLLAGLPYSRTVADMFKDLGVSPKNYDTTAGTGGDDRAAIQAALDFGSTYGGKVNLNGYWNVMGKLVVGTAGEAFSVVGTAVLAATDTASQTCLLEIKRGNWMIDGMITLFGQYKTNYDAAVWLHNDTQVQSVDLSRLAIVGFKMGLRVGDVTHPASVTSELSVVMPRTYGVPRPLQVEGAQSYLTVLAPHPISADVFGGSGAWLTQRLCAVLNIGANLKIIGGEVIQTSSSLATDRLIENHPCLQGTAISWGRTVLIGVTIETGGPLAQILNPNALTGSLTEFNDRPSISFIACEGYHSQDNAPFIYAVADYPGDIIWGDESQVWKNGAARTQPNVQCDGTLAHVYVGRRGFGPGFRAALQGTVGGIVHFEQTNIISVLDISAQTFTAASGDQAVIFSAVDQTGDKNRFASWYSTSTGLITIGSGGVKDATLAVHLRLSSPSSGTIAFYHNGAEVFRRAYTAGLPDCFVPAKDYAAGDTLGFRIDVDANDAGNSIGFLSRMAFMARGPDRA